MQHTSVDDPSPDELLARYFAGECTPVERQRFEAWVLEGEENRKVYEAGRLAWERSVAVGELDAAPFVVRVRDAVLCEDARGQRPPYTACAKAPPVRRWAGGLWTASLGTAVAAAAVLQMGRGSHASGPGAPAPHVYATATGQQAVVALGDGSRVTLAPRSRLRVPTDFGAATRTVALEGEAYFEVARAGGAPFVVRAGGAAARVLGTTFFVRHYATDPRARVTVTSGKVAVVPRSPDARALTLAAGWTAVVSDSGVTTAITGDGAQDTGWVNGRLAFHRAPTTEVLGALERWYGYRFRLADSSLASRNLTAVLSTRSSREALTTLKLVLDVDLAFDGDVVTLTPRGAAGTSPVTRAEARERIGATHSREAGR